MKKSQKTDSGIPSWRCLSGWIIPLILIIFTAIPNLALAQNEEEEEVFELSPFEVESDEQAGYYATETLSGTYLRTSMRDLANPVTVMTEEFLNDIGATDYEEAIEYMPSSGRFEGDVADNDANTSRTGTPYNARGFRVTQLTQNFLNSRVRQDNFNTERLTQSRGPNSVLFGLGSVGGSMNSTIKRGRFGRDTTEFETQFDDFGTHRFELDINRELIEDKLAFRFAALYDDTRAFRDLQFRRRKSLYSNLTWKPFEKTTIHFMHEWGRIDELNPRLFMTKDRVSAWRDSTLDVLEKSNLTDIDLVVNGNNSTRGAARNARSGVNQGYATNNDFIYIENAPELGVMDYRWKSRGDDPIVNGVEVNNLSITDPQVLPDLFYPLDTVLSGPQDQYDTDYYKYGIDIQQRLAENTYLQLTYQVEEFDNFDYRPVQRQSWHLYIDPNFYLPHQSAADNPDPTQPLNPYYGQVYIESNPRVFLSQSNWEQFRANLTHKIDLSDAEPFDGFDLGEISLVGSSYYWKDKNWLTRGEEMTTLPYGGRANDTRARILRRFYISQDQLTWPDFEFYPFIDQPADTSVPGNIRPAIKSDFLNRLVPIHEDNVTESISGIGQWSMFRNRLIVVAGWREDVFRDKIYNMTRPSGSDVWGGFETEYLGDSRRNTVENTNWGVVVRPLPWLDLFMNGSTNNVNAGTSAYDVYNNQLPDQTGEGEDIGFRLFLLDDRVIVKLNYYENDLKSQITNPLRDGAAVGIGLARENGRVEDFLDAMDYNGLSNLIEGTVHFDEYPGNGLWTDVEDTTSTGYELEITANLTRNWRLLFNMSKQDTKVNATFVTFTPFYDQYIAPIRNDTSITSLPADPDDSATETIGDIFDDIDRKLLYHRSQVGGQQVRSSRFQWNLVTSYNFSQRDNWLDDVRLGAGVRYREAPSIGYKEDAEGNFQTDQPFYGDDVYDMDLFVSKGMRFGRGANSYRVNVTFRVRDLLYDGEFSPRTAVDDGAGNPVYLQQLFNPPVSYQLEVDVRF